MKELAIVDEKIFEVENLAFTYPKNKVEALRDVSFSVRKGEVFGILGPSGAGKSTTQKILIRLLKDYRGHVRYRGKDLRAYNDSFYEDIGVGFELPVHFSKLTAVENMDFFKRLYQRHIDYDALLARVGLAEDKERLVGELSKGMKVRLNFVRALLNDPQVLFLDEPTNGLDPANARIIKDLVQEFKEKGGTVILSTHLMNDVEELCDRVAFITQGVIREISTPRDLKIKHGKREVRVEYHENNRTNEKTFPLDTIGENPEFLDILKHRSVETIHSGETSLDEIFIKVTGEEISHE